MEVAEGNMSDLKVTYEAQMEQYRTLANEAILDSTKIDANVEKLKTLNAEIAITLDQMITLLSRTSFDMNSEATQSELLEKLQRIQRDYNGLIQTKDKLETLRRIKEFEKATQSNTVFIYVISIGILAILLLLFMFFRGRSSYLPSANAIPMAATTMAPL
jgi:hypothetical protein